MPSRLPRIALIIFFIGLLAFPLVYKRLSARNNAVETASANPSSALARYGFNLSEASKAAGIEFKHSAPQLDAKLNHIMEQVASMGAAVSVADFDRDGWQDIYVTSSGEGGRNALYKNLGNGQFKDLAVETGLDGLNSRENGVSMGAVWGDYDNDGYDDGGGGRRAESRAVRHLRHEHFRRGRAGAGQQPVDAESGNRG